MWIRFVVRILPSLISVFESLSHSEFQGAAYDDGCGSLD
jgi:hypothetical protein